MRLTLRECRTQFLAQNAVHHYLEYRRLVTAELSNGRSVLIGKPGWKSSGITLSLSADGELITAPRLQNAAEVCPVLCDRLREAAAKHLSCPTLYRDSDGLPAIGELGSIAYVRELGVELPAGAFALYRFPGQSGLDNARRSERRRASNYLVATPAADGWRLALDNEVVHFVPDEGLSYRELVMAMFNQFPDSVNGYSRLLERTGSPVLSSPLIPEEALA